MARQAKPKRRPVPRRFKAYRDTPVVLVDLDLQDPVISEAVISEARAHGWRVMARDALFGSLPADLPYIGAILGGFGTAEVEKLLAKRIRRFVRIGGGGLKGPVLQYDMFGAGRLAAEHFAERGHKHVAYVGYDPLLNSARLFVAFKERAEQLGCRCHTFFFKDDVLLGTRKRMLDQVRAWLPTLPKPIGYLGYHDKMASSVCYLCESLGIAVPDEVAILGHGNVSGICETALVPISSIDLGKDDVVRLAVRLLKKNG